MLDLLSYSEKLELLQLTERKEKIKRQERLRDYRPYAKQKQFHALDRRERLFSAGNQLGKTVAGSFEMAMHLTGEYPDWWQGKRFDKPIVALAGSESAELTRDGVQRLLIGPPDREEDWGTGAIPARLITARARRMGVQNALDSVTVKHASGGHSTLYFKSYDQGRTKWQAATVDFVWMDEEPPEDVYFEAITRTNATNGYIIVTFTPLKGMSNVVARFLRGEESPQRGHVTMTIDDADHISPERKAEIIASYPPHEREARTLGIPSLGAGAIYPVPFTDVSCKPFAIPAYWPKAFALDVGWNKTAAIWGAKDPSDGTMYLYAEHYRGEELPLVHAAAIKARGEWIKGAIDPAARGRQQADGTKLIEQYRGQGLNLTPAINEVEAGLYEVWQLLATGRLRVFSTLQNFEQEYRGYHRDEKGKIVKKFDHLMDAARYLIMTWDKIASVHVPRNINSTAPAIADQSAGY